MLARTCSGQGRLVQYSSRDVHMVHTRHRRHGTGKCNGHAFMQRGGQLAQALVSEACMAVCVEDSMALHLAGLLGS